MQLLFTLILMLQLSSPASSAANAITHPTTAASSQPTDADDEFDFADLFRPVPGLTIDVGNGLAVFASFGSWDQNEGTKRPGKDQDQINRSDTRQYGVTLLFFQSKESDGGEIRYREVLTLPRLPGAWGTPPEFPELPEAYRPKQTISADGRSCTTEQMIRLKKGQIIPSVEVQGKFYILSPFPMHTWGIAPDDPSGEYKLEAFANDKLILTKRFQIVWAESTTQPATQPK